MICGQSQKTPIPFKFKVFLQYIEHITNHKESVSLNEVETEISARNKHKKEKK